MFTTIPENTIVRVKFHGEWEYQRVYRIERNADGTTKGGCRGCINDPGDDFSLQFVDPLTLSAIDKKNAIHAFWTDMGTTLTACKKWCQSESVKMKSRKAKLILEGIKTKSRKKAKTKLSLQEIEQAHRKSWEAHAIAFDEAEEANRQEKAAWLKYAKLVGKAEVKPALSDARNEAYEAAVKAARRAKTARRKEQRLVNVATKNALAFLEAGSEAEKAVGLNGVRALLYPNT